jgi:predicted DNA-binding transcriptional regulator AlpA
VSAAATLARAILDALREEPAAVDELRALLGAQDQPAGAEPWIDARAVALHLGYELAPDAKPWGVYELIRRKDGTLPHRKVGGRVLFLRSEVDAWVRAGGEPQRRRPRRGAPA